MGDPQRPLERGARRTCESSLLSTLGVRRQITYIVPRHKELKSPCDLQTCAHVGEIPNFKYVNPCLHYDTARLFPLNYSARLRYAPAPVKRLYRTVSSRILCCSGVCAYVFKDGARLWRPRVPEGLAPRTVFLSPFFWTLTAVRYLSFYRW